MGSKFPGLRQCSTAALAYLTNAELYEARYHTELQIHG